MSASNDFALRLEALCMAVADSLDGAGAEPAEAIYALLGVLHMFAEEDGRGAVAVLASALLVACGDDLRVAHDAVTKALAKVVVGTAVLEARQHQAAPEGQWKN